MKALFELFRRFDARRIFGFIRRLGGMSRPKVKCYDLRSTRALRVEGDIKGFRKKVIVYQISIHAFRMEGDVLMFCRLVSSILFLSTPSGWRATVELIKLFQASRYFYPRPPGGGRPGVPAELLSGDTISIHALRVEGDCVFAALPRQPVLFLSTPSGWRATRCRHRRLALCPDFYPRPPGGGRLPFSSGFAQHIKIFLSTPSGWRATQMPRVRS